MDYKQEIRDVIYRATVHDLPIFEAANQIEAIIMAHLDGDK